MPPHNQETDFHAYTGHNNHKQIDDVRQILADTAD